MNDEDARAIEALFDALQDKLADRFLEVEAALTAQRFLLEHLLANAFIENPQGVDAFIAGLVEQTRRQATSAEPVDSERRTELQARVSARLLRIGDSVRRRLGP